MTGGQLKKLRTDIGLSQYKCADRLGIRRGALSQWETGRAPVPASIAVAMRHAAAASKPVRAHLLAYWAARRAKLK